MCVFPDAYAYSETAIIIKRASDERCEVVI